MSDVQRLGPYRIIRTIALGGMGEVFLATLERSGGFEKRVALKCVLPRLMTDERFVELFEREARLAAALTHRHIVQIFDFGRDQGRSWLAMEHVNGVDVKAVLDAVGGPLPTGIAIEIGIACARGLDYAHRARDPRGRPLHLIHRDVSPQNVLLSFEGDVKLADFGLAHAASRDPDEGGLQGKFAYMSPEQVQGAPLDARSDQFALAVLLYEMLSGQRAFFADDGVEAILDRVRRAAPHAPLAEVAPGLPTALVKVIERAMQGARTDRFSDAGAFADALTGAASASHIRPGDPPLGPWLRTRFPDRSGPVLTTEPTAAAGTPITHSPVEITAAADLPIAPPTEPTIDALVPVGPEIDPLAATPSSLSVSVPPEKPGPDDHDTASGRPAPTPIAPDVPPVEEPEDTRRALMIVVFMVMVAGAVIWIFGRETASIADAPDARPPLDARPVPDVQAPPVDAAIPDATRPDATPDAAPRPRDATPRPVDARPDARRATRPPVPRVRDRAVPRPPADAGSTPIVDATPPPVDATPPPPDAASPTTPRARVLSPGGVVRSAVAADDGWRPVTGRGLFLKIDDAPGPPVTARIKARGARFEASINARPWGRVLLGERDLGPTPAASIPLEPGRQTITVVGPHGGETVLRIELAAP